MKKKLTMLLCLLAFACSMAVLNPAAAGAEKKGQASDLEQGYKENLESYLQGFAQSWSQQDFDAAKAAQDQQDAVNESMPEWSVLQKKMGEFKGFQDTVYEDSDDGMILVKTKAEFEKGVLQFSILYNPSEDTVVGIPAVTVVSEQQESMGERMKTAGMNTVMGIVIVFLVLIFISFVIWLFKFIPNPQLKAARERETIKEPERQEPETAEEELSSDGELVAVITAAIMASLGNEAPADGLVVRSIKRKNTSRRI